MAAKHYLQTTEEHFVKASGMAGKATQNVTLHGLPNSDNALHTEPGDDDDIPEGHLVQAVAASGNFLQNTKLGDDQLDHFFPRIPGL